MPSLLRGETTFTLSIILVVIAAGSKWAQAHVPIVNGNEFMLVLFAHLVLVVGCVVRGI